MTATINASTSAGVVTTADTSGILQLQTNGTAALTVDASQNVGIGTASPGTYSAKLAVLSTAADTRISVIDDAANARGGYLRSNFSDAVILGTSSGVRDLVFSPDNTERARITTSGNMGIGTTSPGSKLDVQVTSATAYSSGVTGNGLRLYNTSATTGQYVGITFQGEPTSGNGGLATIMGTTTGSGNMDLTFSTRSSATLAERARITSGGNLFVNCTSEPSSSVKGWGITQIGSGNYVSSATTTSGNFDHYYFYSVSGLAGFIRTNGTTCTYNSVSDVRLKENIVDAPSALVTVNNIKVRSFDWKSNNNHVDYGFVAQELNDVAPQAVAEGKTTDEGEIKTPWAIDTSMLIPILVKSIQEQQALITALTTRITALEGAAA